MPETKDDFGKIFKPGIITNWLLFLEILSTVWLYSLINILSGVVPTPNTFSDVDEATLNAAKAYPAVIASAIERYRFREGGQELMNLARLSNKYLVMKNAWKVIKTDADRVNTIMYVALQIASALATFLNAVFLPFTS